MEWEYIIENGDRYIVQDEAKLRSYDRNELEKMLQENGFEIMEILQDRQLTIVASVHSS